MAAKKINTSLLTIALASAFIAAVIAFTYFETFKKVPILLAKRGQDGKSIPAYSIISSNDFDTVYVSKTDALLFSNYNYISDFNQINNMIPSVDLTPGLPVTKSCFISKDALKSSTGLITSKDGRDVRLFIEDAFCYNRKFTSKNKIDLYFIYTTKENQQTEYYIIPVKNLLTLRTKEDTDKGCYIEFEVKDTESQGMLLLEYLYSINQGKFAITLPGIAPEQFTGQTIKYSDFMEMLLKDKAFNLNSSASNEQNANTAH